MDRRRRHLTGSAVLLGILTGCHRVTDKAGLAGEFRHGWGYGTLSTAGFWFGLLAVAVGALWLLRAFHGGPGDRGEAVWGLFLVLFGIVVTGMMFVSAWKFWVCC